MLTSRRRLMGVIADGRFKFLLLIFVRGSGHVISKLWAFLIVVLPATLLTELVSAAAMVCNDFGNDRVVSVEWLLYNCSAKWKNKLNKKMSISICNKNCAYLVCISMSQKITDTAPQLWSQRSIIIELTGRITIILAERDGLGGRFSAWMEVDRKEIFSFSENWRHFSYQFLRM